MVELSEIKEYAKEHSVPIMQDAGIDYICEYIKNHNVKRVLEIGTAIGYSAMRFASLREDLFVTTVEIDIDRYQQAMININEHGMLDRITVFLGDALNFDFNEKYDLIFIDAAKSQYVRFFEKFKNNLAENGVIFSDNLFFHGMVEDLNLTHNYSTKKLVRKIRRYVDFLKFNSEFHTDFLDIGDGVSISRRKKSADSFIVDCFTDKVFTGNECAVCVLNEMPETSVLEKIAVRNAAMKTVFVVKENNQYKLDFYEGKEKCALCGTGTFAAAFVIFTVLEKEADKLILATPYGEHSVTRKHSNIELKMNECDFCSELKNTDQNYINIRKEGKRIFVSGFAVISSSSKIFIE